MTQSAQPTVDGLLGERWTPDVPVFGAWTRVDYVQITRVDARWTNSKLSAWNAVVATPSYGPFVVWVVRNNPYLAWAEVEEHVCVGRKVGLRYDGTPHLLDVMLVRREFSNCNHNDAVRLVQQWCDKVIPCDKVTPCNAR